MTEKEEPHNPKYVTNALCAARIATIEEKIKSIKTQITIGFTASTLIIAVVQIFLT